MQKHSDYWCQHSHSPQACYFCAKQLYSSTALWTLSDAQGGGYAGILCSTPICFSSQKFVVLCARLILFRLTSFYTAVLVDEMGLDITWNDNVCAYILYLWAGGVPLYMKWQCLCIYTISLRVLMLYIIILYLTILLQDAGRDLKGKGVPSGFYLGFWVWGRSCIELFLGWFWGQRDFTKYSQGRV